MYFEAYFQDELKFSVLLTGDGKEIIEVTPQSQTEFVQSLMNRQPDMTLADYFRLNHTGYWTYVETPFDEMPELELE